MKTLSQILLSLIALSFLVQEFETRLPDRKPSITLEVTKFLRNDYNYTEEDINCYNSFFGLYMLHERKESVLWNCTDGCKEKWQGCCSNYTIIEKFKSLIEKESIALDECKSKSGDEAYNWQTNMIRRTMVDNAVDALLTEMRKNCEPEVKHNSVFCQMRRKMLRNDSITQNELCTTDATKKFTNFYVKAAFKIGSYITLVGKVWRESESSARNVTVRVMYSNKRDPSNSTLFSYFEATIWDEFQAIDEKREINFTFVTRHMPNLFASQKLNEVLFVVQGTNTTTAFQFDYQKIVDMNGPTIDWDIDVMTVYDEEKMGQVDKSAYLHLKLLLVHFPEPVQVTNILIFDRNKKNVSHPTHYALVYTKELYKEKEYFFRHYMRTSRRQYIDHRNNEEIFYRLDWHFDENIDFCSHLEVLPTAVMYLSKEETSEWVDTPEGRIKEDMVVIHFIEFYGTKHKLMKVVFRFGDRSDFYEIDEDSSQGKDINNAQAFLFCKIHPAVIPPKLTDCQKDYWVVEDDEIRADNMYYSKQDKNGSGWVWFVAIIMFASVLALIAFGLYVVLSTNTKASEKSSPDNKTMTKH